LEIGIAKRGRVAVDIFEAFPDDARFVEEGVICDKCVEGVVRRVAVGVGAGNVAGVSVVLRGNRACARRLVQDRQVRVTKERDERVRLERRRELKQTVVCQLGLGRVQKLPGDDRCGGARG